jgi:hypothetical protein
MTPFDFVVLAAFLKRNAPKLGGIVSYSRGQWTMGDVEGETCLTAIDLGDKRGAALDLDDPQDEELLLRRLRSRARSAGGVLRGAEHPDQHSSDEDVRSPRSWEKLAGSGGEHPLSLLEALESAVPEPEPVDPYHSETAAWSWLLQHFDRRMKHIAEFLLISASWCRQRRRRARHRAETQWQLPHQLLVGEDDAHAIQPWRKFKLAARRSEDGGQVAIDLWNRPMQPERGQLWLL